MMFLLADRRTAPVPGRSSRAARAANLPAGWRACDHRWERLQERGLDALRDGRTARAAGFWRRGWWVAFLHFRRDDPRHAASLANLGLAARLAGREGLARRRYASALARWRTVPDSIAGMVIARRGRSSLFHLRTEAAHWDAYDRGLRADALVLARDVAAQLEAASRGHPWPVPPSDRWLAERPASRDDLRRFLGAALLIAAEAKTPTPSEIDTRCRQFGGDTGRV